MGIKVACFRRQREAFHSKPQNFIWAGKEGIILVVADEKV